METKPKKREWVKNAAIILLAVLLVLTFFSNTIMNRTLPEVATENVMDGSITAKVRGTGIVTANGNHPVKAEQTREIRAVMVRAGQKVEAGDVLFVLGSGEKSELEQAQEQLRQLQLSYERTALGGSYTDYTADEKRVETARENYDAAVIAFQNILDQSANTQELEKLQKDLSEKRHQLEGAQVQRDAFKTAYDELVADAQTALQDAESQRLKAKQELLEYYERNPELPKPTEEELEDPKTKYEDLEEAQKAGEDIPEEELERWKDLRDADESVKDAKLSLAAISHTELDAAQAEVDHLQSELDEIQGRIDDIMNANPNSAAYQEAKANMDAAYLNYLDLQEALNQRKASEGRSNAMLGLELADLRTQIEEQKQKIADLSGGEENQILAKVSGTVQSIECTAGDMVVKDSVLCIIEVPDMGYTLSFSVTNEQAMRLRVGDSATIYNYYSGSQIVATLESIRVDNKAPQTNKLLTFEVSGNVNAGTELTISVGQRSANFDSVVPKSAIKSDANGTFVYKVEAKNSPLGNRYYARRVAVEVLAQDDTSAAISGDIGWGDYVITTSNAPISNGDMVRLAD